MQYEHVGAFQPVPSSTGKTKEFQSKERFNALTDFVNERLRPFVHTLRSPNNELISLLRLVLDTNKLDSNKGRLIRYLTTNGC